MAYPDTNKPYTLYTDATGTCIGACLTQSCDKAEGIIPNVSNKKQIYYLSPKLSKTHFKWSTVEKEAYAFHFVLQKFDHYLHGAHFVIKTDHKPLKYLPESPVQKKKIQLWALRMADYNCRIEYIAGTTNTCADLFSRRPEEPGHCQEENLTEELDLDVNDNTFLIDVINSNEFEPKKCATCDVPFDDSLVKQDDCLPRFDMISEQNMDDELLELKTILVHGEPSKEV